MDYFKILRNLALLTTAILICSISIYIGILAASLTSCITLKVLLVSGVSGIVFGVILIGLRDLFSDI